MLHDFEQIGIDQANEVFAGLTSEKKGMLAPRTAPNRRFELECDLLEYAEAQARKLQREQPGTFKVNSLIGCLSARSMSSTRLPL
jgi:hypothetical protein